MLIKKANAPISIEVEALHVPQDGAWNFYNTSKIKTASLDKTKPIDLGGFDLVAAVKQNPDNLFVKVFAIKANEVNDNGDCFNESELKKAAHTFIGVPVFVNHQNDNVENARGKVVHSWYDDSKKGIYCINMVDRAAYPRLARGIEEKYIIGTSMGAQVGYSLCSICHNKAHTADEFCAHIKSGKNRKISGKYDCKYHESSSKPEDDCPLDGCKKGHQHELMHKEAKVYEWNFDIKFIEDSFVVNPACHDCLVCDILNVDHIKSKVAENIQQLKKVASSLAETVDNISDAPLEKTAGKTELQALSQAMNLMEHVARSMMAQKQQIQLDYASDLVEHMAKVQSLLDELTEMGYGQLPSPTEQQVALGTIMSEPVGATQSPTSRQVMNPSQVGAGLQQTATQSPTSMPSKPMAAPAGTAVQGLGDLGSITRPTFTGASTKLKKEFLKTAQYVSDKLENVSSELRKSIILLAQRSSQVEESNSVAECTNGNIRVTVANIDGDGIIVGKWRDNKLVSWSSLDEFSDDIVKMASVNTEEAAKMILDNFTKESGDIMSENKTTKLASNASQTEVTTQKQLDNAGPLHARTNKEENIITEARLDNKGEIKAVNDTSSDSPQLRTGKAAEVITQAQLAALQGDLARWDSFPEVITEAQWDEMSRRVSSCCSENYTEQVTQAQLESLQKAHKWKAPEVTTQAQLADQKKVWSETDSARVASSARDLMKAATNSITDAIANYNLSPKDISHAINLINKDPYAQIKAAYLSLINGSPDKVNARIASIDRKNYFAKVASGSDIKPIDAFLAAMGDNIGYNKAEDFVAAVTFATKNQKVFASAEQSAMTKLSETKDTTNNFVSRDDEFMQAFNDLNRSDDGLYKICGTLNDDITVSPSDKTAFMKAAHAYAAQQINVPFIISNIDMDTDAGVFEIDCKEASVCSNAEKVAYANFVSGLTKVASEDDSSDGLTKICGTLTDDILENPANKADFMKAAYKFARKHLEKPFVIANIDISENDNTFEIVCKNKDVCTNAEIKAFAHVMGGVMKTASNNSSENEHDGLYKICGTLTEDVTTDPSDRAAFMKSLYSFAKQHIQKPFVIANVEINTENNTFEVDCKEKGVCSNAEKTAFASAIKSQFKTAQSYDPYEQGDYDDSNDRGDDNIFDRENFDPRGRTEKIDVFKRRGKPDSTNGKPGGNLNNKGDDELYTESGGSMSFDVDEEGMETTASTKRSKMIRQAQMMGGELGGGMGGGGPAGGMGSTMPGAAGAGAAPGAEALSAPAGMPGQEGTAGDMGGEMGADEDSDMKAKPPGTICPVCGSSDVDVIEGKCKCNNCGAEWTVKVNLDITKYPGVLDSGAEDEKKGEEAGGEGFAMPENKEPASMPVAAMTRLNNQMLKVAKRDLAAQGKEWSLGVISPYTGNASTMRLAKNKFMCLDTGYPFEVHVAEVNKGGKKAIFAEWRYDTIPLDRKCTECERAKSNFNRALAAHGIDEDTFDSMLLSEKGKTILAMKNKGLLKTVKTASSNKVVGELQKTANFGSKFPIQTCREKIARKFGENALALSGPCEGNNLADCVCNKLAKAHVYANDLSLKVASIWANEDQMVNCVEDFVRSKQFNMKEACLVCDQLKVKYAQTEDMLAEKLDDSDKSPVDPTSGPSDTKALPEGDSEGTMDSVDTGDDFAETDPFAGENDTAPASADTVTIELPTDVVEKIEQAVQQAKGTDMGDMGDSAIDTDAMNADEVSSEPIGDMGTDAEDMGETDIDATDMGDEMGGQDEVGKAVDSFDKNKIPSASPASKPDALPVAAEQEMKMSSDDENESGENEEHDKDENHNDHADDHDDTEEKGEEEKSEDANEEEKSENDNKEEKSDSDKEEPSKVAPDTLHKTGDEDEDEATKASNNFRKGKISATGEINMNLEQVLKVLASQGKQIKQAKEVTLKNVQDSVGKIQDHKTMGHEEKFEMTKPDVPEAGKKALMGGEAEAGLDVVTDKPNFDAGGGEMGHEKELGYTSEKTHEMTGGNKGAGNHKASSKARTTVLAERIMKNIKTASDSKIENAKPVSEHSEIGKYSDGKDLPKSGNPIKPFESKEIGKTDDNQMMGHEKDTIKDIPKAGKDAPSIPTGGGMNSKYDKNQKNAPEKQTAIKGTVIAGGDAESLAAKKEAATRVAGRKLKEGMISLDKLASEIDKLSRYELSDLKDLETALFGASKKGFDTVAKGTEKPLVISEVSNQRKGGQELQSALQNLFSLHKKNELAKDDPNFELRKF